MPETLYFIHVPKTAGTSLITTINLEYSEKSIFRWDNIKIAESRERFKKMGVDIDFQNQVKIVRGHFTFGLHQNLPNDFQYTTIIREPVNRTISHLMQWLRMDHSPLSKKHYSSEEIIKILRERPELGFSNIQSHYISGLNIHNKASDAELLERAIENIEKHFKVVGLVEKLDESLLKFRKAYQWRYPPFYSKQNVTTKKELKQIDITDEVIKELSELNKVDVELYRYCKERFSKTYPIDDRELKTFKSRLKKFQAAHRVYLKYISPIIRRR